MNVSIAGAIVWGVLRVVIMDDVQGFLVSIAGAILWGVLHDETAEETAIKTGFNRRGDSLGGAARKNGIKMMMTTGFNRRGDSLGGAAERLRGVGRDRRVSIAGAILWGVLRHISSW